MLRPRCLLLSVAFTWALGVAPVSLQAQAEDGGKSWELESELGASVFFGASEQTAVLVRSGYSRTSEHLELSLQANFDYGEAQAPGGRAEVNKRSWLLGSELDYQSGPWSPFLFVTAEESFERGIDLRTYGGVGARLTFADNDRSKLDLSAAVLGERTNPRTEPGEEKEVVRLARASARLRANHEFVEDRTTVSLTTFYRPALDNPEDYTVDLETGLGFRLNGTLSFKVSLVNRYDNLATSRGAIANNDGRIFFSVVAQH